jgi:hypothetical protein
MIAIALTYKAGQTNFAIPKKPDGTFNYDMATPADAGSLLSLRECWDWA